MRSAVPAQVFGETFAGTLADLEALVSAPAAPAPRSTAHVVRTCSACGHSPHGIGIICWQSPCACRGNGGGHL